MFSEIFAKYGPGRYSVRMRQSVLNSLEEVLPQLVSPRPLALREMPKFPGSAERARALYDFHKTVRDKTARYGERVRLVRSVLSVLNDFDEAFLALPAQSEEACEPDHVSDDDLRRVQNLLEAGISRLEVSHDEFLTQIANFAEQFAKIVRSLKAIKEPAVRNLANEMKCWVNSSIMVFEADRDLMLAMKIAKSRIEMELEGQGKVARTRSELKSFLADCWT